MRYLQRGCSGFSDQTIDSATLEAGFRFATLICNTSDDSSMSQTVFLGPPQSIDEFSSIDFGEEDTRTVLNRSVVVILS